ncbi:MAG: methionine adenosyltransferase, partial [Candidatus Woesearchaeota archaeon]
MKNFLFTSESVTEGHPDKVCDIISDSILNECLVQDKNSRVAIETMAKENKIILSGELTTKADLDYEKIVKKTLKNIGYNNSKLGLTYDNFEIELNISKQSEDISRGVDDKDYENKLDDSQGAGDQGLVFGYATNETDEFMPITSHYANLLAKRLAKVRKENSIEGLGPDGKTQVTMEFDKKTLKPKRIDTVVLSTQHDEDKKYDEMRKEIIEKIIKPICSEYIDDDTKFLINPTGKFIKGGPIADCGLTGRKIIVDTYGGVARHGGGAFSGKDPSKTDRSAAYAARYAAKNIVAAGLCDKCEIQISY